MDYPQFLFDYLYVDISRVRSYLSQLRGGLPESETDTAQRATQMGATAGVPIIKGERSTTETEGWGATRSLGDLLVRTFEEEAEAAGFLTDISGDYADPAAWRSGEVAERLQPGRFIRFSGPGRLIDPVHTRITMEGFDDLMAGVLALTGQGQSRTQGTSRQRQGAAPSTSGQSSAFSPANQRVMSKLLKSIIQVMGGLIRGGISLRLFPCGTDNPDCSFGGLLLDRSEYIEPERAALFARHGLSVSDWTVLASVARLSSPVADELLSPDASGLDRNGRIDRVVFEDLMVQMLRMFETPGFTEGPVWPSIAVTPLAVYRAIAQPQSNS